MILPDNFTGVLLLDYRDPKKSPIKLTSEQKLLQKQTTSLLGSMINKNVSKDSNNQRTLSTLIIIMKLENNTIKNVNILYKYFRFFQLSKEGRLITNKGEYKSNKKEIQLIGMDNYQNVSCYIDSVLVALFYSSSSFDFLLDKNPDIELSLKLQNEIEELKIVLRFIVNLMRAGEHINTNIMYQLFLVLSSLGCDLALSGKQQDSLQLFEFLAESLSLPLLTIKLDIIHSGKLNLNDDMRLIEERTLLISVPKSPTDPKSRTINPVDPPVSLEECLNTYFNNSVTVRRHLDKKRINSSLMKISTEEDASENLNNSSDDLLNNKDNEEINEYEKLGIIKTKNDSSFTCINSITPIVSAVSDSSSSKSPNASIKQNISSNSTPNQQISSSIPPPSPSPGIDSVINYTPSLKQLSTFSSSSDSIAQLGSINNVSEKLEKSRTRSSTLVSVFNNVPVANPTKLTRRSSSISNSEVSLPAWMFLQLLPYYTDPAIKLRFENHEESYRSTMYKIKTLESDDANSNNNNNNDNNDKLETSKFESKFSKNRPIVPICLKKYYWNERGQSTKIERKVSIPEKIEYPYFIAEDKTKDGFVDFRRSCDNKAPCGSFMLVLQSCVCHRGTSVNAGHYVTITRKHPNSKDWILFNDMEIGSDKVKTYTFDEVMEKEDAYLLFYEIVEIKDLGIKTPAGGKESYWGRKPSVVSGISGSSEITLQETEENRSGSSLSKNHLMHISLPGLNLSKSHSKLTEIDDVIHEYYWNDNGSDIDFKNSNNDNSNKNYNNNNNNNNNAHINVNNIGVNSMSSTGSSNSDDYLARSKSGTIEYCDTDDDTNINSALKVESNRNSVKSNSYNDNQNEYDLPMVSVMEVQGSSSTQIMEDDDKLYDGEIELHSDNFEFRNHGNSCSNSSRHSVATVGTNKTIKKKEDINEAKKIIKKNKANGNEKKKGGKIKRIFKKFLN